MANERPALTVRLLIFSGRPDPEWELDATASEQLRKRLASVRESGVSGDAPPPSLGYRGFVVRNPGGAPGIPAELFIGGGLVREGSGAGAERRQWRDTAGLEDLLLSEARQRDHGELLEALAAGSGRGSHRGSIHPSPAGQ